MSSRQLQSKGGIDTSGTAEEKKVVLCHGDGFSGVFAQCEVKGGIAQKGGFMRIDTYTRICLTLIVLLLVWLAVRPYTSVTTVQAATPVQYKLIAPQSEDQLNTLGKDGWILVTCPWGTSGCFLRR